ncbi:MAG: Pvc16 family protein [Acidimicrobiia bacterium]
MSNALAVAAATRTLRHLLRSTAPQVTMLPLDRASEATGSGRLNIYLYSAVQNTAWRSSVPLGRVANRSDNRLIALDLRYVITAYADDEAIAHESLGRAMSILNDHPVVTPAEILAATAEELPDSDLHEQTEQLRITPLNLGADALFEVWRAFRTSYRISAAYELAVVLLGSATPATLGPLAQLVVPVSTWGQLAPDRAAIDSLRQIAERAGPLQPASPLWGTALRTPASRGLTAVFAGDDDASKRAAAEALANDLRRPLYRVDLGRVDSAYIGETEKQLAQLFDAAERSGAILLFDEADALFGRRTDVDEAHDRYANLETAFRRRLRDHDGLAILATSTTDGLDLGDACDVLLEFPPGSR